MHTTHSIARLLAVVFVLALTPFVFGQVHDGTYRKYAVAADHVLASEAGAAMLARGGNAVDAAVAASFVLSVVRPNACGIGGGGFMMIHRSTGDDVVLIYRERAPACATPDYYEGRAEDASQIGGAAAGVPGTVAGLMLALEKYGSLDRSIVLEPAILAAEKGYLADGSNVAAARGKADWFNAQADRKHRFKFLWERLMRRGALKAGDRIVNPEQASALRLVADSGSAGFYDGVLAEAIVQASASSGGGMTLADLRGYRVEETIPLYQTFLGRTVLAMPPPSSGGIAALQILKILEPRIDDLRAAGRDSPAYAHTLAEAMKHAFADRARYLADSQFSPVPIKQLLDGDYLSSCSQRISASELLPPAEYGLPTLDASPTPPRDGGTSHVSVVDEHGNAVACTETINLTYGSCQDVRGFGFLLNNQMDDFLTRRGQPNAFGLTQSERNLPAPGKRPLSSMTPTIVLGASGDVEVVAGASGGPRIITSTVEALLGVLLFDQSAADAVNAPRIHHQWSPMMLLIENGLVHALRDPLTAMGHDVQPTDTIGNVQLIRRVPSTDLSQWQAASDPRTGGCPAGE